MGFVRRISKGLSFAAALILIMMVLQTVADVVSNNLLGRPIDGNIEIMTVYYMAALAFLPLAITELRKEHINTDFVFRFFPSPIKKAAYLFGVLVTVAFFGILTYQTLMDAIKATEINEQMMGAVYVTVWPAKWILPVAFFMAAAATVTNAVEVMFCGDPEDDDG